MEWGQRKCFRCPLFLPTLHYFPPLIVLLALTMAFYNKIKNNNFLNIIMLPSIITHIYHQSLSKSITKNTNSDSTHP